MPAHVRIDDHMPALYGAAETVSRKGQERFRWLTSAALSYENEWYDGRAAAESAKSLTFKYAVGGAPYGVEDAGAKHRYAEALAGMIAELASPRPSPRRRRFPPAS